MSTFPSDDPGLPGMVYVPPGPALVGSDEGSDLERPRRQVELPGFLLDETPVTNAQFEEFVRATGYRTQAEQRGHAWGFKDGAYGQIDGLSWRSYVTPERAAHPVILVSFNDAQAFAAWQGKRLPTELEWEAAAAVRGSLYPWGDAPPDDTTCNWRRAPADPPPTTPVRAFRPNARGLFDLVGNVWQWCAGELLMETPSGPSRVRPRRGGAWNVIQDFRLRCANRGALPADVAAPNIGFRCALDACGGRLAAPPLEVSDRAA